MLRAWNWIRTTALQPGIWYTSLTTEQKAGWVTAVFTAVQAVFVCATLIVAFYEWSGHRSEEERTKINAITTLYFLHQVELNKMGSFLAEYERCERYRHGKPTPIAAVVEECANKGYGHLEQEQLASNFIPALLLMDQVQTCVLADTCDARMAKLFFCPVAKNLKDGYILAGYSDTPYHVFNTTFLADCAAVKYE